MQAIYFIIALILSPVFVFYLLLCVLSPLIISFRKLEKGGEEEVYIVKDAIHADYIFKADQISSIFKTDSKFIKVGWGERKIFLETRDWSSLKLGSFLMAFLGMSESVLRVEKIDKLPDKFKTIKLNDHQLAGLLKHIKKSFYGETIEKLPSYYKEGEYYKSRLHYSCITNCNNWVNRGLFIVKATNKVWCPLSAFV